MQGPKNPRKFEDRPISTWYGNSEWKSQAKLAKHLGFPYSQELLVLHHLSPHAVQQVGCMYARREANPEATGAALLAACKN
jgi:hypothetical protein